MLIRYPRLKLLFSLAMFFIFTGNVQAANYFSWGVESLRASWGVDGPAPYDYELFGNTVRDCTVAHSGSCSMRMTVDGNNGNWQTGADTIVHKPFPTGNVLTAPALYYRFWFKGSPGFYFGPPGWRPTKASRVGGPENLAIDTAVHLLADGIEIEECNENGCKTPSGAPGDGSLVISYDFRTPFADGNWHEIIYMIYSNRSASCTAPGNCDAQFKLWVDNVFVGQIVNFKFTAETQFNVEQWHGPMVRPYWQLNGGAGSGGTVWIDSISVDDVYTSLVGGGGGDTTPPTAPTGLGVQ
ncbi:MAG: hypothetical protein WBO92_05240 [Candidatus Moraniibacteriota bacterium]